MALIGNWAAIAAGVGVAFGVAATPFGEGSHYDNGGGSGKNYPHCDPLPHGQNVIGFATNSSVMA